MIECTYCGRMLQEFHPGSEIEGDEMWIFALNDGEGGEGVMCQSCWEKRQ
jgi:hypothetical protein